MTHVLNDIYYNVFSPKSEYIVIFTQNKVTVEMDVTKEIIEYVEPLELDENRITVFVKIDKVIGCNIMLELLYASDFFEQSDYLGHTMDCHGDKCRRDFNYYDTGIFCTACNMNGDDIPMSIINHSQTNTNFSMENIDDRKVKTIPLKFCINAESEYIKTREDLFQQYLSLKTIFEGSNEENEQKTNN
jgi:hypothetical protein